MDFREYLQAELLRRTRQNPRYSLRAFARNLSIQPDYLSKFLLGRRPITPKTIDRLGPKLGLSPLDVEQFRAQASNPRESFSLEKIAYRNLEMEQYALVSEWYHFGILELTCVKGFRGDFRWISRKLGISTEEAKAAVDRLQKFGFLCIEPDGTWRVLDGGNTTTLGHEFTNAALKKMQSQILRMALQAMETTDLHARDQTSMTMAIDPSLIPEAKKRITEFRRSLCKFLEKGKNRDELYLISISLFPAFGAPGSESSDSNPESETPPEEESA